MGLSSVLFLVAFIGPAKADGGVEYVAVGPLLLLIGIIICIYYVCCRNKNPNNSGFRTFGNEGGNNDNCNNRWRNRRFFRRNNRNRNAPALPPHQTHVVIQPIIQMPPPPGPINPTPVAGSAYNPTAPPPPYNDGRSNPLFMVDGSYMPQVQPQPPLYGKNLY